MCRYHLKGRGVHYEPAIVVRGVVEALHWGTNPVNWKKDDVFFKACNV